MVPSEFAWPPLSFVIIFKEHSQESSPIVDLSKAKEAGWVQNYSDNIFIRGNWNAIRFKTPVACKPDCSSNSPVEKEVAASFHAIPTKNTDCVS